MSTKTEERLKSTIKEYLDEKQVEISSHVATIFLWGFVSGMLFAYSSLASVTIGLAAGYALAKKDIPLLDFAIIKFSTYLDYNKLKKLKKIPEEFEVID